jgi:hypothetical protein
LRRAATDFPAGSLRASWDEANFRRIVPQGGQFRLFSEKPLKIGD